MPQHKGFNLTPNQTIKLQAKNKECEAEFSAAVASKATVRYAEERAKEKGMSSEVFLRRSSTRPIMRSPHQQSV
jgi:hypothetical protein